MTEVLGLKNDSVSCIQLEKVLNTSISHPNLDVFLSKRDGTYIAIESEFTEWISKSKKDIKPNYFSDNGNLIKRWDLVGLPNCQKIEEDYKNGNLRFHRLDVPQLLKHALGIGYTERIVADLWYIYFDLTDKSLIKKEHDNEIKMFSDLMGDELNFKAISYQKMFENMLKYKNNIDIAYIDYLEVRYFPQL